MEKAEELMKTPKMSQLYNGKLSYKLSIGDVNLEDIERHPTLYASPRGSVGKPSGSKSSCLCSPTTHAGSFRCRYHRAGFSRTGSVGTKLALLDNSKSEEISDSLQAQ